MSGKYARPTCYLLGEVPELHFPSGSRRICIPYLINAGRQGVEVGGLDCVKQYALVHQSQIATLDKENRRLLRGILRQLCDLPVELLADASGKCVVMGLRPPEDDPRGTITALRYAETKWYTRYGPVIDYVAPVW